MQSLDKDGLRKFKQLSDSNSVGLKKLSFKFTGVGLKTISVEGGIPTTDIGSDPADFFAWYSGTMSFLGASQERVMCPQAAMPYGGGRVSAPTYNGLSLITPDGKYWFIGVKSGTTGLVLGSGASVSDAVDAATTAPSEIPPTTVSSVSGFDLVFY